MIWMISLRMFFIFEVGVLEVPGGFRAWFQQSFWTFELKIPSKVSWSLPRCLGPLSQDVLVSWSLPRSLGPFSQDVLVRFLFIGVLGWVGDMLRSLIGDTCHSLIGPLMSSLTSAKLHMSSLTHAGLPMSSRTCTDV